MRPVIEGRGEIPPRLLFAEDTFFFNTYAVLSEEHKFICNRIPPPDLLNLTLLPANLRGFYRYRGDELYTVGVDPDERHQPGHVLAVSCPTSSTTPSSPTSRRPRYSKRRRWTRDLVDRLRSLGYVQ